MRALRGFAAVVSGTVCAAGVLACGGGERQDADEPSRAFRLEVVSASFPSRQTLADTTRLRLDVRNADTETVPDVAVTITTESGASGAATDQAFATNVLNSAVADPSRPIWVVDDPPRGGSTAATNTWALGSLEPGETKRFTWRLTAVRAGAYTVGYAVAPGLTGKARAEGGDTKGSFRVRISDVPPGSRVDEAGNVVRGSGGR